MCDRHPPFDTNEGDRVVSRRTGTLADAMNKAETLATVRNERQRITIHDGPSLKTFHIQAAERYAAWAAKREEVAS